MRNERFGGVPAGAMFQPEGAVAGRRSFGQHTLLLAIFTIAFAATGVAQANGRSADSGEFRAIPNHVPSWASPDHFVAAVPDDENIQGMTLVLARHADRQQAFEALLAAQQDPSSPEYHRWLTSEEIGERFGLSTGELDSLSNWLESEGLHVDWVAPARNFIGFSGAARDVSHAFQADLNYYDVKGERKVSVATDPMVPVEVAPMVKAIRGLYTVSDHPMHQAHAAFTPAPGVFAGSGNNFVGPDDFATIYDVPSSATGKGITIGIVGESRTDFSDFTNFRSLTGTTFADPTEVVPPGGIDPGAALTAPPTGNQSIEAQLEATLDVYRAASIAQEAKVLLVVESGTIDDDAQYLIQSTPPPAQVVNISFGGCESEAGLSGVNYWDELFSTAAGKGISVFVASGDSGASGCDPYFKTPPSTPAANSPNYICSSSYATCLGGTEFNDASDYAKYWNTTNGTGLASALSYIPEGAWNEPLNGSNQTQAAGTGGGVSLFIPTPSWQTGKGVPAARAGRYTPDIAFSAAGHDGYFGCMAAANGSCVSTSQGTPFVYFLGTSAAAPDMAGITALLDQKEGKGQGNLNPRLYAMAASSPSAFHDVTVASSGVKNCSVNTPSICNNSIPGPTGLTGGQAGFLVTAGFDEATGLGSLDVANFLASYSPTKAPLATTGAASGVKAKTATLAGTVNPSGQSTQYWFAYGTSSSLSGASKTAPRTLTGSSAIPVTAPVKGLTPGTKYYFQLQTSSSGGTANGAISSFVTPKGSQAITFTQPKTPVRYGVAPISLAATSSSGLPVAYKVISGPGVVIGSTLKLKGAGIVVVAANQAGNTSYTAASQVTRTITVAKAGLTVTAKSLTMIKGGKVPPLQFEMTGWVNGDTRYTATKGLPVLATTATMASAPGNYPITISAGSGSKALTSTNYAFHFLGGWMRVNP